MRATGPALRRRLDDLPDVVLGQDADAGRGRAVEQAEAAGPEPDLGRRFLARRVQDADGRVRAADEAGGGLEQERGLADPRFAAEQDERPGHEPAAEDAVQLADPDGQARDIGIADLGERRRGGRAAGETRPTRSGRHATAHG